MGDHSRPLCQGVGYIKIFKSLNELDSFSFSKYEIGKYRLTLGYHSLQYGYETYETNATELHIHPNLTRLRNHLPENDIALLKMKTPITSIRAVNRSLSQELKSICLPQKGINITEDGYALSAGWGQIDRAQMGLQMGYKKIHAHPFPYHLNDSEPFSTGYQLPDGVFLATVVDNQTFHCYVILNVIIDQRSARGSKYPQRSKISKIPPRVLRTPSWPREAS